MARSGQLMLTLVLLASAGGLLAGLLSLQAWTAPDVPENKVLLKTPDKGASAEQPLLLEQATEPVPLSEYVEMIKRPLFSPHRRPPSVAGEDIVPDTQEAAIGPAETNQFLVMGIVIAQDEKVALLKQLRNNEILRVKEGQKISDWTVSEITPKSVTIVQGGVTEIIKLSDNVLSAAEKLKLTQQAKLEQATNEVKQKLINRRLQPNSNRRNIRQLPRLNRAVPQTHRIVPGQTLRTPAR